MVEKRPLLPAKFSISTNPPQPPATASPPTRATPTPPAPPTPQPTRWRRFPIPKPVSETPFRKAFPKHLSESEIHFGKD